MAQIAPTQRTDDIRRGRCSARLPEEPAPAPMAAAAAASGIRRLWGHHGAAKGALRVLLIGDDIDARALSETMREALGDDHVLDWAADTESGSDLLEDDNYQIYLVAESPASEQSALQIVRAATLAGCRGPIIVLRAHPGSDFDLRALDIGAADCIERDALTSSALKRSIQHALVRGKRILAARQEIETLAAEKMRLGHLRDANHRFVGNACHDFRTPLTVIKEFASIIAEALAGEVNSEQSEFLGIIISRADHLSHMVDAILDASRLESELIGAKRCEHAVEALIAHALPPLRQHASAQNIRIETSIEPDLPNVFCDAESVGRVIENLVANACKFTGQNGVVRLWARSDADGGAVRIGVADDGPGIAPEHLNLIFERFQQVAGDRAAASGGFGLGLHIANELVRLNYGALSVESEPGKGSTFSFTLAAFDFHSIIPLHFGFLRTARQGFQRISIASVSVEPAGDAASLAEIERFLWRQLRSYDLMLRVRGGVWIICAACDELELAAIVSRILGSHEENNRNRPDGPLPDIQLRPVGSWALRPSRFGATGERKAHER